jgi:type VI secretion system secreted protein VgrG
MPTIRTSLIIGGNRISDNEFSHISLRQGVGRHHQFEVRLLNNAGAGASRGVLAQKAQLYMGKPVQIGFGYTEDISLTSRPLPDCFKGIITGVSLSRQSGTAELVVTGQSPTVAMDEGAHTHSYEDKSLSEIGQQILSVYSEVLKNKVEPAVFTESIPYTVQYKESNFAFLARLAAKYGEWFYYDGLNVFFGKPADAGPTISLDCAQNDLMHFEIQIRTVPTDFKIQGYDYMKHKPLDQKADIKISDNPFADIAHKAASSSVFNKAIPSVRMQRAMDEKELKQIADRKSNVHISEMVVLTGNSRNPNLKVGSKVLIKDTSIPDEYGEYSIISISHDIGQSGNYSNHFEAIPASVLSPPISHSSEPPTASPQAAEVKDINDPEKQGRVRVKFGWQEGAPEISPWIRVASPYTGKDKGIYFQPEIGDHVLVAFEQNNPEKPYVLTGMYHGEAKPENAHAKNDTKSIKTRGGNSIVFGDKKGSETITITAPHKIILQAGQEILIQTTGENGIITINAGATGTVNIEKAKIVNIKAEEMVNVDSKQKIATKSTQTTEIVATGDVKMESSGGKATVKSASGTEVDSMAKTKVSGTAGVEISSPAIVEVKGTLIKLN